MKILIITLQKALGASIFFSPVLRLLRKGFPDARIELLVAKDYGDLYRFNPYIDKLIIIDRQQHFGDLKKYLQLIKKIRAGHYDISINVYRFRKAVLLNLFSGAKVKCDVVASGIRGCFFTHRISGKISHIVDPCLAIMNALNITDDGQGLEIWVDQTTTKKVNKLWSAKGLDSRKGIIGINPGASKERKRWTSDGFADLINLLHQKGYTAVLFGGPSDKSMVADILAKTVIKPPYLTGELTVLQLAAAINKCDLLVTNDSGPMHLAAAFKRPIVALFGPSNHILYKPYKAPHIILKKDYHCYKCKFAKCKRYGGKCMSQISPDEVLQAVEELLKVKV